MSQFLSVLAEGQARTLAASALGAKAVTPFEMKGARQVRIVAETIAQAEGVPRSFARALQALDAWIRKGCPQSTDIQMVAGA